MKGPAAFWTLLLGSVALALLGMWLIAPRSDEADSVASGVEAPVDRSLPDSPSRELQSASLVEREEQSASRVEVEEPDDADWWPEEEPSVVVEQLPASGWTEAPLSEPVVPGVVTVHQAARRLGESGPALVIIFSTTCPRSRAAFPQFARLAERFGGDLEVLAFATDSDQGAIDDFVARSGAGFAVERIERWERGEMSLAMGRVGIRIGSTWLQPLIAVFERDGRVLGQWQGLTDLRPVEGLVRLAGF